MPNVNGSAGRVASDFEAFFTAARGRAPTSEETRRCLAFNRLAKESELDPATLAFIVGDSSVSESTGGQVPTASQISCTQLDRVEALLRKNLGKPIAGLLRDVIVFGVAFVAFTAIAWFSTGHATSAVMYAFAIVLGLAGSVAYLWFGSIIRDRR